MTTSQETALGADEPLVTDAGSSSQRRPPRPSRSVLAQTLGFLTDPLKLLEEAAEECGDVFSIRVLGMGEWVFLTSPATVKEMFKASYDVLDAGKIHRMLLGNLLGLDATFTLDGKAHRQRQKLVFPLFNGPQILKYIPTIRQVTEETLARWPIGQAFPLVPENHRIALEVLVRAMLASGDPGKAKELLEQFDHYASEGPRSTIARLPFLQVDLGRYSPWGKILRLRQETRKAFLAEIRRRRALATDHHDESPDALTTLINSSQDDGTQLSEESLLDEVLTLLFAGHETTGVGLSWIAERVLAHPDVETRLREEIDAVLGDEPIEQRHLCQLKYLNAVIHESHRCRPIAPMAAVRTAVAPFEVGGYVVPQGAIVAEGLCVMGNRPELYPEPERFDPDRFLDSKPQRYEWTPFGGGKRVCAGKGLAHLELTCATATLFQRTKLRLQNKENRMVREGQMFSPERGLEVVLEERL
ncbi:MAG: cytochrome P450 [Acidobacteriota bacterium]